MRPVSPVEQHRRKTSKRKITGNAVSTSCYPASAWNLAVSTFSIMIEKSAVAGSSRCRSQPSSRRGSFRALAHELFQDSPQYLRIGHDFGPRMKALKADLHVHLIRICHHVLVPVCVLGPAGKDNYRPVDAVIADGEMPHTPTAAPLRRQQHGRPAYAQQRQHAAPVEGHDQPVQELDPPVKCLSELRFEDHVVQHRALQGEYTRGTLCLERLFFVFDESHFAVLSLADQVGFSALCSASSWAGDSA